MRIEFDWDPAKAASNVGKHRVRFEEAIAVFRDPLAMSILDTDHGAPEERWVTIGSGAAGKLVLVVHTWVDIDASHSAARIICARRPTRKEAR
jgi:uncharacterized DUF497 family protein